MFQTIKTGEVDDDRNDNDDQNDATTAGTVNLNNLFHFNSEILTSEKQELESWLISIPVLR